MLGVLAVAWNMTNIQSEKRESPAFLGFFLYQYRCFELEEVMQRPVMV